MAEDERLKIWETLFQRALELIDSVRYADITVDDCPSTFWICAPHRRRADRMPIAISSEKRF